MQHAFIASQLNRLQCGKCKRVEIDHTDRATCESCGNTGNCELIGTILMCMDCQDKENEARIAENQKASDKSAVETLNISKQIDQSISVREDIFNAKTKAIVELKNAIDSDNSIENKHFTLARALEERYNHLSEVIKEGQNEQRAIQIYFNDLLKKLREEERAQIKIKDVNYKPAEPKITKKKAPVVKKYDLQQLKLAAAASKLPINAIQMMCIQHNISPMDAVRKLKEMGL